MSFSLVFGSSRIQLSLLIRRGILRHWVLVLFNSAEYLDPTLHTALATVHWLWASVLSLFIRLCLLTCQLAISFPNSEPADAISFEPTALHFRNVKISPDHSVLWTTTTRTPHQIIRSCESTTGRYQIKIVQTRGTSFPQCLLTIIFCDDSFFPTLVLESLFVFAGFLKSSPGRHNLKSESAHYFATD